ncbi:GPI-anchored hemophore cfmA-like [Salvia splendens]|uniref:GPI-anchored hemophore cfmA-like n=1 Tax=Salvia splendens TaxID=180675 RepID=UPI001C271CD3|nr:GPI-anchored hemophore cfmA-like [Salvia splendens]
MGMLSSGIPDTPAARLETPVPTRGGSDSRGGSSRGGGDSRGTGHVGGCTGSGAGIPIGEGSGTGGSGGSGSGSNRGKPYTKDESIVVAKAWDAITSDSVVGTDQAEGSF